MDITARNKQFQNDYKNGLSVSQIAKKYGWSNETVRKAVCNLPEYGKKLQQAKESLKESRNDLLSTLHHLAGVNSSQHKDEPVKNNGPEPVKEKSVKWVANNSMLNVVIDGHVYATDSSHPKFSEIIDLLIKGKFDDIPNLLNQGRAIEEYSNGLISYKNRTLYYAGEKIHGILVSKIVESLQKGDSNVSKFVKFLELALENEKNSVDEMYNFLKHCDIEIDENGYIVGYKKVTRKDENLVDSHTKTVTNNLGTIVKMPKSLVNNDKNVTCSHGLHVGSIEYVRQFYGDVIVKVLVSPADVVSVPIDYNGQKMRCSEYFVKAICDSELNEVETAKKVTGVSIVNKTGQISYSKA